MASTSLLDLPADLHLEDDAGLSLALLEQDAFDPAVVYPGAVLRAGREDGWVWAHVLRTELVRSETGVVKVLVRFRQEELVTLEDALSR